MFNPKVIKNFVSKEDCEYLINAANSLDIWESGGSEFWDNRVINYNKMLDFDKNAAVIMLDANIRCGQKIKEEYNLDASVYSDTLQVIRWFPGMEQPPHADDMSNTDIVGFDHRAFGSIIYLNNDYTGGHTFYPNFDFEITPEAGSLAIHPGDPEHLHGVTKVEGSMRYTIASFWTFKKERSHEWRIS
jgi:prolyl 4-hydroxylase